MAEEVEEVGTNALAPEPAPVLEAPEAVIEETPETVAETDETADPAPKEHHLKGKTPWYMERINEETNKRRLIEEQLGQKSREAEDARAMLERLQAGDKTVTTTKTEPQDIDALVDARAEQKLFNQDCNAVAELGARHIPDFKAKLDVLRSIGVVNDDFLKDIFAVDKAGAHKILGNLSENEELANSMVRMDSRSRIAALTRMTMTEKPINPLQAPTPKAAPVSKVPAPKPVVNASSGVENMDENDMSDEQWSVWRKKELAKQRA